MALRKAWQKMKRTLSSWTRQFLVTNELWEIFLAKDQMEMGSGAEDSAQKEAYIEKLRLMRKKALENLAKDQLEMGSGAEDSAEKDAYIEKIQLMREKRLEKILARNKNDFSSQTKPSNEKGNLQLLGNDYQHISLSFFLIFQEIN